MTVKKHPLLLLALAASLITQSLPAQQPGTSPVKVFVMIGQSNTEGHGEISPGTTKGTLEYIVLNDPGSNYQFLVTSGTNWVVRDDVWVHYERLSGGLRTGDLQPGYGPELGFGHRVGNTLSNQILLVKACWGGRSLGNDFLPPSSGANLAVAREWGDPGYYYKETLRLVEQAIGNLGTYFTNYNGQGFELAGICYHQGWNDRVSAPFSASYQTNMANFIRDIRSKEYGLDVPGLPFVIASTGMDGATNYTQVELAQLAMTNTTLHPDFAGNVAVVNTRTTYAPLGLDFWQAITNSPADQNYHWNRNAKTYLHIGLAMGNEMPQLNSPGCRRASGSPGRTARTCRPVCRCSATALKSPLPRRPVPPPIWTRRHCPRRMPTNLCFPEPVVAARSPSPTTAASPA
jgi:alpha-galactosidase